MTAEHALVEAASYLRNKARLLVEEAAEEAGAYDEAADEIERLCK